MPKAIKHDSSSSALDLKKHALVLKVLLAISSCESKQGIALASPDGNPSKGQKRHENESATMTTIVDHSKGSMTRNGGL